MAARMASTSHSSFSVAAAEVPQRFGLGRERRIELVAGDARRCALTGPRMARRAPRARAPVPTTRAAGAPRANGSAAAAASASASARGSTASSSSSAPATARAPTRRRAGASRPRPSPRGRPARGRRATGSATKSSGQVSSGVAASSALRRSERRPVPIPSRRAAASGGPGSATTSGRPRRAAAARALAPSARRAASAGARPAAPRRRRGPRLRESSSAASRNGSSASDRPIVERVDERLAVLPGLLGERAREQLAGGGRVRAAQPLEQRPPLLATAARPTRRRRRRRRRARTPSAARARPASSPSGPASSPTRRCVSAATHGRAGRAGAPAAGARPAPRRARATRHEEALLVLEQRPQPRAGGGRAQRPRVVARRASTVHRLADPRARPPRDRPRGRRREQPVLGAARVRQRGVERLRRAGRRRRAHRPPVGADQRRDADAASLPAHSGTVRLPSPAASGVSAIAVPQPEDRHGAAAGEREQPPAGLLAAAERQRAVLGREGPRVAVGDRGRERDRPLVEPRVAASAAAALASAASAPPVPNAPGASSSAAGLAGDERAQRRGAGVEGQLGVDRRARRRPRLERRARRREVEQQRRRAPSRWPHSHVRATRRRSCSSTTRASTVQRSRTCAPASTSSRETFQPSSVRTSSRSGPSARPCASHSRCSSPRPDSSRSGHPSGRPAATLPSDRSREAAPGACASTIRAANASHSSHVRSRPAPSPPRTASRSHSRRSSTPAATRSSRSAARRAAASGSRGGSPGARAVGSRRDATHSGRSASGTPPAARSSNSASACLHGTFRLGQEHCTPGR